MGKECAKLDVEGEKEEGEEEKGNEFELNLDLSIGGRYGKAESSKGKIMNFVEENVSVQNNNSCISRSDFFSVAAENGCESMDLQRRREIQALRRQEARRKREEKAKKSRGQNVVGFMEDRLFSEAQRLQARAQERETRERDCLSEERDRRKGKSCSDGVADELSLSLFTDNKSSGQQREMECLYPKVQHPATRNGVQYPCAVFPAWGPNVGEGEKNGNSSVDCYSEHSHGINDRENRKTVSNRSLEQCSSAVSDYQSMSYKGGSSSDTGSHSSLSRPLRYPGIPRNALDHQLESHDSSSLPETDQVISGGAKLAQLSNPQSTWRRYTEGSRPDGLLDQTNNTSSTSENMSKETSGSASDKPPKPSNCNLNAASVPHMPCVSATGNGPNGKTITGFLYKYTKTEVSILCVCHGRSFTPAEFVEHAGGVDITHPLKHITIVPSAFG